MENLSKTHGKKRSSGWAKVRAAFLKTHKLCAVCRKSKKLEAHHIVPFHIYPKGELDPGNLIALCEADPHFNCHLLFGHLGNFKGWNPHVRHDAISWREKLIRNKIRFHK